MEEYADPLHPALEFPGIDNIPVVSNGIIQRLALEMEGLDIVQSSSARGTIPHMADSHPTGVILVCIQRKYLGNKALPLAHDDAARFVHASDAATFLSPVLQETQAHQDIRRGSFVAENAEYATLLVHTYKVFTKSINNGCGCRTVVEYSGWNCVPTNQRRPGISTISTRSLSRFRPTQRIPAAS